jgi:hypothetical protein
MSENTEATNFAPLTPYAAFKVTNRVLEAQGIDKTVSSQMLYGYAKTQRIATVRVEGSKKVYFDGNAFKAWLDAYIAGGAESGKVNLDALVAEYL